MTFTTYVLTYLLGGVTFIPLLLAAIVVPAWLLLPKEADSAALKVGGVGKAGGKDEKGSEGSWKSKDEQSADSAKYTTDRGESGASGTFAVLRSYDFQAATAALNARQNANVHASATGPTDASGEGGAVGTAGGGSVYQNVYRSVFERKRPPAGSTLAAIENEDASLDGPTGNGSGTKAKKRVTHTPADIFYIALRHGHLMLYDSAAHVEVRHVISLAHHSISLSEGGAVSAVIKDGDLFIKRTAILLTPIQNDLSAPNGQLQPRATPARPYYLFSTTCIEKEDFYHALLLSRSSSPTPIPQALNIDNMIKLQSSLHSTTLANSPEARAVNAFISRIFLALHRTDRLKNYIKKKVEKKISRVQKPAFISAVSVREVDLGDAAPVVSSLKLRDLNISGDLTLAFDIKYTGGIKLTVSALAALDLGPRFKRRSVDLVLATSLTRLTGSILVRVKPPPSNRIWFCFESVPEMDVKVEPVVSTRQITYTFITKAIEDRVRGVVAETLVRPNWDDISFFDTRDQRVRGGIWLNEGDEVESGKDEVRLSGTAAGSGTDVLKERNEKTKSMPVLASPLTHTTTGNEPGTANDSSATSSGSEAAAKRKSLGTSASTTGQDAHSQAELKRRSVASLPATAAPTGHSPASRPMPLRSPSVSSPSVQLDESPANFDPATGVKLPPQRTGKWRLRAAAAGAVAESKRKDAVETMRETRDRSLADRERESEEEAAAQQVASEGEGEARSGVEQENPRVGLNASTIPTESSATTTPDAETLYSRSLPPDRVGTTSSSASTNTNASSRSAQQRKNFLATATAATTAARDWSWNAIQASRSARGAKGAGSSSRTGTEQQVQEQPHPSAPVGRGQPLPPPGTPLPGPQREKGFFGSIGAGSLRRKPVLPPRRGTIEVGNGEAERKLKQTRNEMNYAGGDDGDGSGGQIEVGEEFGPWRENSGAVVENEEGVGERVGRRGEDAEDPIRPSVSADGDDGEEVVGGVLPASAPTVAAKDDSLALEDTQTPIEGRTEAKKVPPPLPARPQTFANGTDRHDASNGIGDGISDGTPGKMHANIEGSADARDDAATSSEDEVVAISAPMLSESEDESEAMDTDSAVPDIAFRGAAV